MADQQKKIFENVEKHGWHAQLVGGDEAWPAFAYSIGWGITRDWPEVIVVGQKHEVAHGMLAQIWESGNKPKSEQMRNDVLPDFRCKMLKVDLTWYEFLFGAAIDFYMDRDLAVFEAYQCTWPTTSDILPWEKDAPDGFARAQPLVNSKMAQEPGN